MSITLGNLSFHRIVLVLSETLAKLLSVHGTQGFGFNSPRPGATEPTSATSNGFNWKVNIHRSSHSRPSATLFRP